uniref:Uncharacterized protein n=1 Tax=Leersia perrieri TaxID=77586 RepID=A0A0D9WCJ9_9ORYZ
MMLTVRTSDLLLIGAWKKVGLYPVHRQMDKAGTLLVCINLTHRRAAQMKRVHLMMMKSKRGNRRKEHRILHKKLQSDSYRCHNGGDSEAQLSIQIIGP